MTPLSAIRPFAPPELQPLPPGIKDGTPVQLKGLSEIDGMTAAPAQGQGSFGDILGRLVNDVNSKQVAAGEAVSGLLSGQNVSLHQAMISMEEASVSFQLMVEVRNKLLESYQELMRMQI
jgi:flagellar hook-basal body complex protein FliE